MYMNEFLVCLIVVGMLNVIVCKGLMDYCVYMVCYIGMVVIKCFKFKNCVIDFGLFVECFNKVFVGLFICVVEFIFVGIYINGIGKNEVLYFGLYISGYYIYCIKNVDFCS